MKKILLVFSLACVFVSCSDNKKADNGEKKENTTMAAESKQERNKKVIMANMEAAGKADVDGMLKDATASFTEYFDGSIPPTSNMDSLKTLLKSLFASFEGYKPSGLMCIAEGDYVAAYATWTGVFKNDFMGLKATGKSFSFPDVDIFKFNEEGKIIEHRSVQNTAAVLMASGMMK